MADREIYLTPSAEDKIKLSASLRAGIYDAGANILRTCSLPNLVSIAPEEMSVWDVAEHQAETKENVPVPSETGANVPEPRETGENAPEPPVPETPKTGEDVPAAGGDGGERDKSYSDLHDKDDVFYEGKGGASEEEEEEEEEWSSSEDEDLQQLVETLQSFVEEASESKL